ncbi:MAG TPA: hypothetical protein VN706_15975 [Gemmatimonadaceae bacterium]|jgi:hypothetical protein|nr:hypothetical protein [Gemmatimonadaceae bacterium]
MSKKRRVKPSANQELDDASLENVAGGTQNLTTPVLTVYDPPSTIVVIDPIPEPIIPINPTIPVK